MTKVLFIYPNINAQEGFNHGIAALSGALKAIGAEVALFYLNDTLDRLPDLDAIAQKVIDFDPHLICFSAMSQQYKYALKIARELKRRFPYPIAIGGVHATMVPQEVAKDHVFDFIGLGECDRALPALVRAIRGDRNTTTIPNIWAKTEDGYRKNPVGDFPDLEILAPKDYEVFDLDLLLTRMNGWMSMITSRGCPYRCSYCLNHRIVRRYREEAGVKASAYLRRYPIPRIMEEMKRLKDRHSSIRLFIFDDDLFTLNERYVLEFCDAYAASGIELPFVVNGHVQVFTPAMARALKDAGCRILKFGVESGSERIRRSVLKRDMTNAMIGKAFACAHDAGLHTSAFLMIGLPLETREDLEATIDLVAGLEPGRFRWAVFYPFPGTDIHRLCRSQGLLDPEKMKNLDNFYEASPLLLEPSMDLLVRKLQRCFHWYVNAGTSFDSAPAYQALTEKVERMSQGEWKARTGDFLDEDRRLSERMEAESKLHYSIRFTQVMAVRSDYREEGGDLDRPAKEWKSKPQKAL